jgi:trk system potassium uptake protein TrkA
MYIVVVGGGKVGYYLTKTLLAQGHEVALLEHRPEVYRRLETDLGEQILMVDGATPEGLLKAGVTRADVVVACTGFDEDNLVVCQLARRFGARRTIARINNPKNQAVFDALQAGATVSSTAIIAGLIEQEVETAPVHPLTALAGGRLSVVEMELGHEAPAAGQLVSELPLPPQSLLVSVTRGSEVLVIHGSTRLAPGDRVVAVCEPGQVATLRSLLCGELAPPVRGAS